MNVVEATEPNSIRWEDLNFRVAEKLKQTTITAVITVGAILVGTVAVTFAERASPGFGAAFTISGKPYRASLYLGLSDNRKSFSQTFKF